MALASNLHLCQIGSNAINQGSQLYLFDSFTCLKLLCRFIISAPFQSAFTCSKLTIETLERGLTYVES